MEPKIDLSNVTYLSIVGNRSDSRYTDVDSTIKIGQHSSKKINFGRKVIYTFEDPSVDPEDFEIVKIPEIQYEDFSVFVLINYNQLFETDFMINFHHDGFIENPDKWDKDFLNYDFIGAPMHNSGFLVNGNGGFSLRSKNFTKLVSKLVSNNKSLKNFPEDVTVSLYLRFLLEGMGINYAPLNVCEKFSLEHHLATGNVGFGESFGFHEINKLFDNSEKTRRAEIYSRIF